MLTLFQYLISLFFPLNYSTDLCISCDSTYKLPVSTHGIIYLNPYYDFACTRTQNESTHGSRHPGVVHLLDLLSLASSSRTQTSPRGTC